MSRSRDGRSRPLVSIVVAAALVGAAGLAVWAAVRPTPPEFDLDRFARALEARLGETAAGLHIRLATLAELPRLAVAVATDARTVTDLTQDELAFRPHPGETIAIGQIPKRGGKPPVLLRLVPEGAAPPSFELGGPHLHAAGEALSLTEAASVIPRERAREVEGVIAVSWAADLRPLSAGLIGAGVRAEVMTESGPLPLGVSGPEAGAVRRVTHVEVRRAGASAEPVRIEVTAWVPSSPDPTPWLRGGAIALALVGLGAFVWGRRAAGRDGLVRVHRASSSGPIQAGSGPLVAYGSGPIVTGPGHRTGADPGGGAGGGVGRVGRYELLETIGAGGMAQVYLARATGEAGFTKLVALKVLLPDFASQPQVVEHFLDEARLAAQLYHPNIVQTTDLGHTDGHYFMAMEYIDGTDLLRLINLSQSPRRPVPLSVALGILRGVCAGLQAAHDARQPDGQLLGLVHRDVKSANVFVARTGAVKVGDFGIAKAHHASWVRRTENGLVKGTPGYMAPEQRLGQAIDGRADLYGVGAIAYELLTGRPVNLDLALLAAKGQDGWPHLASIASVRPDVPPELEAAVMRALAFDREDRFPSCAALEQALEAIAVAHPPVAGDKTIARWVDGLLAPEARVARAPS